MQIPDGHIDDFITRWKHAFNETLTREEARTRAHQLVELFKEIGRRPRSSDNDAPPAAEES